jgi:hypothetical protein
MEDKPAIGTAFVNVVSAYDCSGQESEFFRFEFSFLLFDSYGTVALSRRVGYDI